MKHIFILIDRILKNLEKVHKDSKNKENIQAEIEQIDNLLEDILVLEKLIESSKLEPYFNILRESHIKEIEDWEKHIENVFKKLNQLLETLKTDIERLAYYIENDWSQFYEYIQDISFGMFLSELTEDEQDLVRSKQIAIFSRDDLIKIIGNDSEIINAQNYVLNLL